MIDLGIDFETYYSTVDYTLRKMMLTEYVLDPRFQTVGVGLVVGGHLPVWIPGTQDHLKQKLSHIPWDRVRVIAHNAMFEAAILEWVLGFKPAKYLCTMMAARPYVAPYTGRADLGTVLKFLQLGEKGTEVENANGLRLADFPADQLARYGVYCCDDAMGGVKIAQWMEGKLPVDEQDLIDLTIKKFARPRMQLSGDVLDARTTTIAQEKASLIFDLATRKIDVKTIRSRPKFAALLEDRGVPIPKKVSAATNEETYAFSKQDAGFVELLEHDDPEVRFLVEARFKLASNMEESRLMRLKILHDLNVLGGNLLPIPLLYYGAHTGRFSGFDKINMQNPPRHKYDDKGNLILRSAIRDALVAPPGWKVLAADLANIEARIVATLAGCWHLVKAFAENRDTYAEFATDAYGRPVNKKNNPVERFVGKTCILGLGYGMGWAKLLKQLRLAGVDASEEFAKRLVYLYRDRYEQIPGLWGVLEGYLRNAVDPKCLNVYGPLTFMHERIMLPNGMPIIYPGLRRTHEGMIFRDRRSEDGYLSIWGGAVTENVVQALARIILTRAELRLARAGLRAVLQVHDELVFVVPEKFVAAAKRAIEIALLAPVDFLPGLPIAVEIHAGDSYGDAK